MRKKIKARDPKPSNRDPQPVNRDPEMAPDVQHPPVLRVPQAACFNCGHTTWRAAGGTTRPNISTREMARYRRCAKCGKTHWLMTPMTEAEIARHVTPAE